MIGLALISNVLGSRSQHMLEQLHHRVVEVALILHVEPLSQALRLSL